METLNFSLFSFDFNGIIPFLEVLAIALILIILFNLILLFVKRSLLKRAKSKNQISNIKILSRIINIVVVILIIILSFFSYVRSWTGIGVVLGLLTAALGFALQKPITGVAAWLMVVLKRPFRVGDRITIGGVKGDVYDISLTHLYIDEVGGELDTEQHSGRNILVPNYKLFDENIINHTLTHDLVIEEIVYTVTYESDLDKAMNIGQEEAEKLTGEYTQSIGKKINARVSMDDSGLKIKVNFFAPIHQLSKIKSDLTKKIYESINKDKKVELAYPRREITIKKG